MPWLFCGAAGAVAFALAAAFADRRRRLRRDLDRIGVVDWRTVQMAAVLATLLLLSLALHTR